MTIEPLFLNETSSIAYPEHFYPAEIEVSHHQLRNFISTVYHDKIFYANKHDIYILDLETRQRSLLVTVEFEARCLAAAHGWVCVGGETKGDCAFIHIGETDGQPGTFCYDLEIKMLGKEIVNAMNIQVLKPEPEDAHGRDEIVVLISNNDHTVTIYSLSQSMVLTIIEHPQPMNYASLSPDSTIMAAMGDENKAYFLRRILIQSAPSGDIDSFQFSEYEWYPLASPEIPRGVALSGDFGFAVAFSPDGRLCAVSSQGGAITVFDMDAIADMVQPAENAITCTFRSSRDSLWGCVRSMAFSPSHWNVLAWTEDHGRIGLADVRQGFQRRQHLQLSKEKMRRVNIHDSTPSEWKSLNHKERVRRQQQQRMQALRGHPSIDARSMNDDTGLPTATDDSVLPEAGDLSPREGHTTQSRDTILDDAVRRPYSINYIPDHVESAQPPAGMDTRRAYEVLLLNPSSRFLPSHVPRRRSSVVLSDPRSSQRLMVDETSRTTMTASPGPISDDGMPPPMSTNDLTPASGTNSSQPLPYNIPPSDPWHVIEASLAARRNESNSLPGQSLDEQLQQIEVAIHFEQQLSVRMDRQLSDEHRLSSMLRSTIDTRELISQSRQQEARAEQSHSGRLSPRVERLRARQLAQDLLQCQVRLASIADMVRTMSRRINDLMDQRNALLQRHNNSTAHDRPFGMSTTPAQMDPIETARRVRRTEDERTFLMQQVEQMEREVRRAENNIEQASYSSESIAAQLRDGPRARANDRGDPSQFISRLLSGGQISPMTATPSSVVNTDVPRTTGSPADQSSLSPAARRMRQRVAADLNPTNSRSTVPRTLESTPRRATPADLYTARFFQRSSLDINGNWRRGITSVQSQVAINMTASEEFARDAGVGTTGIGWSPDGLKLFAGSEQGIFEFRLNVQDRLQCPLIEFR